MVENIAFKVKLPNGNEFSQGTATKLSPSENNNSQGSTFISAAHLDSTGSGTKSVVDPYSSDQYSGETQNSNLANFSSSSGNIKTEDVTIEAIDESTGEVINSYSGEMKYIAGSENVSKDGTDVAVITTDEVVNEGESHNLTNKQHNEELGDLTAENTLPGGEPRGDVKLENTRTTEDGIIAQSNNIAKGASGSGITDNETGDIVSVVSTGNQKEGFVQGPDLRQGTQDREVLNRLLGVA